MSYETDYSTLVCVHFYSIAPELNHVIPNAGNGLSLEVTMKNNEFVNIRFLGTISNIKYGANLNGTWMGREFRPKKTQSVVGHFAGTDRSFHIDIEPDGSIKWWGANIGSEKLTPRGNGFYFLD